MESELAGLGFRFVPLKITAGSNTPRAVGSRGPVSGATDGGSGGAADRPLAARTNNSLARSKSVGFNLKQRRPGSAYSSPETTTAAAAAAAGEQARSDAAPRALAGAGSPRQPAPAPASTSSSLAHLKLASLRRRAVAAASCHSSTLPAGQAAAAPLPQLEREVAADQHAAELLHDAESLLAGCDSAALDIPQPDVPLPPHLELGRPVLVVPPLPAGEGAAAGLPLELGDGAAALGQGGSIAAFRPASTPADEEAADAGRQPATTAEAAEGGSLAGGSLRPAAVALDSQWVPASLQDALQCLGLLAQQRAASEEDADSSGAGSSAGAGVPHWVRLHAVQLVLAGKQAADVAVLAPSLRRLRQVQAHLAFHQANVQRGRSPRRSTSPALPGPWLSGRSSAQHSKHRGSRSGSPGLQPRPKVAAPTPEASELQVQLLVSLRQRLLLKLGLAALRQAAGAAGLQQRLLTHVAAQGEGDLCRSVLQCWHAVAVPSQEQDAAAASLSRELCHRRQRMQLAAWQQWAAHHAWQRRQLECALRERGRHLLATAVQHWRCYCQQQLVQRLQGALAARWAAAWGRRRVLAAWRQAARRSALLKEALLVGRPSSAVSRSRGGTMSSGAPPSQQEALAATAAAFAPVKAFVAEATQQLGQLRRGLRFSVQYGEAAAVPVLQQQLEQSEQEPLPVGSVEALLAVMAPPAARQQAAGAMMLVAPVTQVPEPTGSQRLAPVLELPAAGSAAQRLHSTVPAAPAAAPAPDPGSPPPAYNPSAYASPGRPTSRQRQRRGRTAVHADSARLAEPPAAVEAELVECQRQVVWLQRELDSLEQESTSLRQECAELEAAGTAAGRGVGQHREACTAAAAVKEAAAAAMQAAVQQHISATAECAQHERELKQRQLESQEVVAAAAGARAAAHAAAERQSMAQMAVQRWRKTVEAAAKELSATHRSQQAPVQVRLREARQQLERHQAEAAAAGEQLPELQAVAEQAARRAQQAQQVVLDSQQRLVAAAEQRAARQRELDAAMGRHEAAAVEAVAAEQEADADEQRQRMRAVQQQAAAGRLRQVAQQVLSKQQEAVALQERVTVLQQRHREAVAAALAAEQQQQQHVQQRRGKLKRRLQLVAEEGGEQLPASPTASQQRRPAPMAAAEAASGFGACMPLATTTAADEPAAEPAGQLVLCVPQPSDWSCCSSEPGSPPPELDTLPPLTVEEAAARFHCQCLMHRGLRLLQEEARAARVALLAADGRWRRRQTAAVLHAWKVHAAQAADWLFEASSVLRRRGVLRQWRAEVALRRWRRQAEDTADGFARWHMLAAGMAAWRQHLQHERWRDGVHEAVVLLRLRNMLQGWRQWTRRRRQKAAGERAALAVYERRLAAAAFRQWRWVQHSRALLRRVFGTAVELWQEEVGVRLYERNHERLQAAWGAWQLAVLKAQAVRQQAILWNAAAAFREKQLQLVGLQAFRHAVVCAREERRLARIQVRMFAEWRLLAASSARHWSYEAARRHCQRHLLRLAVRAWRDTTEATASQLARFWLRWQVQAALQRTLQGWRCAAAAEHEARVLGGMAEVHRKRRLLQGGLDAFAANVQEARSGGATSGGSNGSSRSEAVLLRRPPSPLASHGCQQQQQHPVGRRIATISVSLGSSRQPSQQQQRQGMTTTISISTQDHVEQEQVPPARASYTHSDGGSCVPAVAEAARGMLDAVSSWRAAAEHWRQRHQSLSQQSAVAAAAAAAISPRTLATLAEVRAQQRQR